ncbi:DUF4231 domain-containing protein [Chondrinema litorale]|uniref:DUF4231 domain-containing protein n=1 Tax=Chondrinema litorale TaxID=2994555 RepID=UPI002543B558|nr:DUF4231 domain-containing protein [Chondrinema litorale]UZR97361.1 DUF4231 domain-containing protein [Chondrinema litorale]
MTKTPPKDKPETILENNYALSEADYIKQRLDDQIKWYSKKSSNNKKQFYTVNILVITLSAFIPFLSGLTAIPYSTQITGFLGIVIAVVTGLSSLMKYQENWITYRKTGEQLNHEKYMYATHSEPYHEDDSRFNLLVQRVEEILENEHKEWTSYVNKKSR